MMDINSLLSPQDSPLPGSGSVTPVQSPLKTSRQARSSSLKQNITSSPRSHPTNTSSVLPHHVLTPGRKSVPSPPALSPTSGTMGGTPPPGESSLSRKPSTNSMDTLADLASMQHPHPASRSSGSVPTLRKTESYESQLSPSTMFPNVPPVPPQRSNPRSSFDQSMPDASHDLRQPKDFSGTSLSEADQQLAAQLVAALAENPHSYEHHFKYTKLLHQGFMDHVYPQDLPDSHGDPHKYDLLEDLRAARLAMNRQFAVGHDLWSEWIQDESMLATTVDERIAVMELCQKSIEEEFGCTKLWRTYGEWMLYLHTAASQPDDAEGPSSNSQWSEEDKLVGREVFTWSSVLEVWQRGAEASKWRMHDSHLVWNRWMELLLQDLSQSPSAQKAAQVKQEFENRLEIPHATWDETFQMFSTFISSQPDLNDSYEEIMVQTQENAKDAKRAYSVRESRELSLSQAADGGDTDIHYANFIEYLGWSVHSKVLGHKHGSILANALYQRAVLYFPTDTYLWQEYAYHTVDESLQGRPIYINPLELLERATRHCPWSGALWSQYLLSSETTHQTFDETEEIKHKATSTGLLDVGEMEEVLKVLTAWCSYLRRRAFHPESTDEELDIAEVGIRSSIESLQKLGEKKYGDQYKGDPLFRLERIYIKYLCESGSWDNARETYKGLVATRGDSHDFWMRYYTFEMIAWGKFIQGEDIVDQSLAKKTPAPSYATAVLKQALGRPNLDWPERICEVLISHCEDHEDVDELQLAVVEVNRATKVIAKRREKEASVAAAEAQKQIHPEQKAAFGKGSESGPVVNGKRKRSETDDDTSPSKSKKTKPEPELNDEKMEDQPRAEEPNIKRDRENASVVVKNLPSSITETRIRQFFRDCGTIKSLKLDPSADGGAPSALVEFESKEDALFAQSRHGKSLDDSVIDVQIGTGSTLYVTNYPPTADESFMRDLFSKYGEIISIRLPSLKYNTHRRFCYVQFASNSAAYAATELNGTTISENGDKFQLVAKISDPTRKADRSGPMEERREIHVAGIHFKMSEDDLKQLFAQFGKIERVRIPLRPGGDSKGFGFVVFASKESADAALALDQTSHIGRKIAVSISAQKGHPKRTATTIISGPNSTHPGPSMSPPAAPVEDREMNGTASRKSSISTEAHEPRQETFSNRNTRSLGLMNIPDTVNDARIRTLVEEYGPLVKIVLRPDHQGAIIEFQNENDAGKAALALDGKEITEGRKIAVGSVPELFKQAPELKVDTIVSGKGRGSARLAPPAPIKRPGQGPAIRGRRGGLGFSQRTHALKSDAEEQISAPESDEVNKGTQKSNADFRALFAKGK